MLSGSSHFGNRFMVVEGGPEHPELVVANDPPVALLGLHERGRSPARIAGPLAASVIDWTVDVARSVRAGSPCCRALLRCWPADVGYQLRRANHHQAIHTGRLITAA